MTRMVSDSKSDLHAFVAAWRIAAARLDHLRRQDLRNVDVADHIMSLNGAFKGRARRAPVRKGSGLVEQQSIFSRLRNAGSVPPGG